MDNAVTTPVQNTNPHFNETQWLQALFLLAEAQGWLQHLQEALIWQLPVKRRKKLLRQGWYLSAKALAHILERHYCTVPPHPLAGGQVPPEDGDTQVPLAGRFTIPIPQIVACIKEAGTQQPIAVPRSRHLQRVWDAGMPVGYDPAGNTVTTITVISSTSGEIITAFPGTMQPQHEQDL
ncbi:hypothetical protein A8C56_22175 [Niabella ginsenosidivorans]|uniref:Uncharacterized protein n=1 Tax=Niabella ginsenosidivorans TaxID=1176587 RepID=A0A1A9I6M7_9BACT|nr:hypothetical protein [Niabella ginsenosidivorans]ANH83328.1 hypothetical protein A8C56_22175 [Niabella ginsenosidivorans]